MQPAESSTPRSRPGAGDARQRFGDFLLLKRLTADALGETYRAGRLGDGGIERVVRLRLVSGPGEQLWARVGERRELLAHRRLPHLAGAVEMGVEGGSLFTAHQYVSGRTLAELLDQARTRPFPIPTEHALFVIEKIALGLAAAFETRFRGERIHHGFLIPELVNLSNEGEVLVSGLELGPALPLLLADEATRRQVAGYLAPEILAGADPAPASDVYSLGSISFELLTGQRLPAFAEPGFAELIDRSTLATEGSPLPAAVRNLLKNSLVGRDQRIGTIESWRQVLDKVMLDVDHGPSTFNLAFFMHTLFRGEIEAESQEIEEEKSTDFVIPPPSAVAPEPPAAAEAPRPAVAPVPAPAPTPTPTPVSGARPVPPTPPRSAPIEPGRAGSAPSTNLPKVLLGVGAVAGVAAAIGLGYFLFMRQPAPAGDPPTAAESTAAGGAAPASAVEGAAEATAGEAGGPAPDAAPAVPDPAGESAEVESQVRQIIEQRASDLETSLQREYGGKLADLRKELAAARAAKQRPAPAAGAAEEPRAEAPQASAPPVAERGGSSRVAAAARQPPVTPAAAATAPAAKPAAPTPALPEKLGPSGAATRTPSMPAPAPTDPPPVAAPAPDPAPPVTRDAAPQPAAPAAASPAEPEPTRRGDLVSAGAGVSPPRMLGTLRPQYPPAARKFNKSAAVRLRVLVDENGKVAEAEPAAEPAGYGFDAAALSAARRSKWRPATKDGVPVKFWVDLTVRFEAR